MAVKNLFELSRMQNKNTKKQHRSKKKPTQTKKVWNSDEDIVTVSWLFHFRNTLHQINLFF